MTTLQEARQRLAMRLPASVTDDSDPGPKTYYLIGGASLLLLGIGVVMVLSATTITSIRANDGNPFADFLSQGRYVLIGLPLAFVASRIPVRWYRRLAWPALILSFGLQILIFTPLALSAGGNTNWIWIPGIGQSIQPSEFLKIGLALWLGLYLATQGNRIKEFRHMVIPLAVSGIAVGLVLGGHDLGTALVLVMMIVGALWIAGAPGWWFGVGGLAGLVALAAAVVSSPSRMARVLDFLGVGSPDPTGAGYQSVHGLWGLGTGGFMGVGLGASREKWAYLPAAHNDFIFAIIGEELGLLGTLLVLGLFGVLAYGMLRLIRRHPDPFVKITTFAIMAWIIGQALVNIGVVIGVIPVIGVPLPLVSAGGSAMISTLIAFGILLAFARDEPGAASTLAVSPASARRSLAVVATGIGSSLRRSRRG
ncbi:MAG TPA: putative lipid II flippase FtsW [Actinomycetaceae bacterium]|nr:putative lipid II flippase FtsW [Actinomycetaceae bacterium]